jgi:hypothetical protein
MSMNWPMPKSLARYRRAPQESAVLSAGYLCIGQQAAQFLGRLPVGSEIILSVKKVVVDPRNVRDGVAGGEVTAVVEVRVDQPERDEPPVDTVVALRGDHAHPLAGHPRERGCPRYSVTEAAAASASRMAAMRRVIFKPVR